MIEQEEWIMEYLLLTFEADMGSRSEIFVVESLAKNEATDQNKK